VTRRASGPRAHLFPRPPQHLRTLGVQPSRSRTSSRSWVTRKSRRRRSVTFRNGHGEAVVGALASGASSAQVPGHRHMLARQKQPSDGFYSRVQLQGRASQPTGGQWRASRRPSATRGLASPYVRRRNPSDRPYEQALASSDSSRRSTALPNAGRQADPGSRPSDSK
jgi:hypothetical protein